LARLEETVSTIAWFLPWTGLAIAVLYAGYVAYKTRLARERQAREPPAGPDPAEELARINTQMVRSLADARLALEKTRETVRRQTEG
jgi:hypothetical protein